MDSPLSSAERPRLTADCHLGAPRHRNWHVIGLPAGIKIVPGQQKKADRNVARGVVPGSAGDECGRDAEAPGRRRAPPWRPGRGDFILKVTQWKRGVAADKWFPSPYQALSLSPPRARTYLLPLLSQFCIPFTLFCGFYGPVEWRM